MSDLILIFINDGGFHCRPGSTVAEAVAAFTAVTAEQLATGVAHVTDGRGISLSPGTILFAGAILRVVVSARAERDEADAHA